MVLREMKRGTPIQAHRLIQLITEIQLPVVSVVKGWAAGLGCQIALASDFRIATATSCFWEPFLDRGFSPDSGATWLLPRLIGVARAKEMLLLGRKVSGTEAAEWGLILRAVPEEQLGAAAEEIVSQLVNDPTAAIGLTKQCTQRALDGSLYEAMEAESNALELSSRSKDFKEGLTAFSEGREPNFTGL